VNIVLGVSNAYSWERVISYKYFFWYRVGNLSGEFRDFAS